MSALTLEDKKLCTVQAKLFEQSLAFETCSSPVFVRRFMNSDLAKRMDGGAFLFESNSTEGMFAEIREQYGKSNYGTAHFTHNQLYWMGYLYRYWCCLHKETSQHVYRMCGVRELADLFEPYHTLDTEQAISRILEAKGIDCDRTSIRRGVEALRRIRSKNRYDYHLAKFE